MSWHETSGRKPVEPEGPTELTNKNTETSNKIQMSRHEATCYVEVIREYIQMQNTGAA